jgi:hypothetical protein
MCGKTGEKNVSNSGVKVEQFTEIRVMLSDEVAGKLAYLLQAAVDFEKNPWAQELSEKLDEVTGTWASFEYDADTGFFEEVK